MAGHVRDQWTDENPETRRRVRNDRWGKGLRWKARYPTNGGERTKSYEHKDAAEAWLARQNADVTGVDPRAGSVPFRVYAEQWRAQQLQHKRGTRESIEIRLRKSVYPVIGDRHLNAVRRSDVQHLVTAASKSLAPSTVRVMYSYVVSVFKSAVIDRLIVASPCVGINLPVITKTKARPLTAEQVTKIRERVPDRWKAAVTLAAASGLRPGEWRGLTIDNISPALHVRGRVMPTQCVLTVEAQLGLNDEGEPDLVDTKTEAGHRSVKIGPTATRALVEHLAAYGPGWRGLVFHNEDGSGFSRSQVGDVWRVATKGMGLGERSGWHMMRHFHASLLIADGRSPRAVADRLGHADASETLTVYAHLWPTDEQASVDAIERTIGF